MVELGGRPVEILVPRIVIEVATDSDRLWEVVEIIKTSARRGEVGDGRIFVLPIADSIRIRTGRG